MAHRKSDTEAVAEDRTPKSCAACGRTMTWRKSWAKNWNEVRFCSEGCRRQKVRPTDVQLEEEILRLLRSRGAGKTICPSEAARAVAGTDDRTVWEPLMEAARAAARRLVAKELIDITQHGHVVDASTAKGPIRLRLR